MITTIDSIRRVRPVAQNIDDAARIEPYIREAELLNIAPQIGVDLYRWLDETDFSTAGPWTFAPGNRQPVTMDAETVRAILFGGYYGAGCGCREGYSMGLTAAVAYYAYSRAVMNNQVNVTSFGVVRKRGDYSDPVDASTLVQVSREAYKLGEEITREVVEHLRSLGLLACAAGTDRRVRRFMCIDKKRM